MPQDAYRCGTSKCNSGVGYRSRIVLFLCVAGDIGALLFECTILSIKVTILTSTDLGGGIDS